jgi:putative ABC transport system permease protein
MNDLKFAFRQLSKDPGFTAIAVLTLALGVGASTAIYSVVDTVLLNPFPGPEPDRLMSIGQRVSEGTHERSFGVTPPALEVLLANQNSFANFTWWRHMNLERKTDNSLEDVSGVIVSPNFFTVWGVHPLLGRTFAQDEAAPTSPAGIPERDTVIVLSYWMWQSLFGGDPGVLGKTIPLSGRRFTIVGVMPPYFQFPTGGYTKFWVPAEPVRLPPGWPASPDTQVLARLKPGVSPSQAQATLDTVAQRLEADATPNKLYGEWSPGKRLGFWIGTVRSAFGEKDLQRTLLSLLGAIGFFLLIACANIANLTLARTEQRRHELAVRAALGAGQGRLVRQFLTESLLLAGLGGLAGLGVTPWCVKLLVSLIPETLPRLRSIQIDGHALGFALLVCLVTGLAFGLAPAFHAGRTKLSEVLQQAGNRTTGGAGGGHHRGKLVSLEVALTLVLLAGAGLMIQSVVGLLHVKSGFDPNNLLFIKVWLPWEKYGHEAELNKSRATSADQVCDAIFATVQERVASLPGVKGVGYLRNMSVEEYQPDGQGTAVALPCVACGVGDRDVFRVMRVPLLAGRYLEPNAAGDQPGSVLVNESLARRCWPGQNAVGKRFRRSSGTNDPEVYEVVGIVSDARLDRYDEQPEPTFYVPYRASARWTRPRYFQNLVVRTQGDPSQFIPLIRKELKAAEPAMKAPMFTDVRRALYQSTQVQRIYMGYLVVFAGTALLLSAIGLYGVLAYSVARRTREIGIRMTLGADRRNVLGLVLAEGARMVGGGVVVGILAAFWLTRLLRNQLFGVSPTDPLIFGLVVLVLVAVALVACLVPALRALRVDPMKALKCE